MKGKFPVKTLAMVCFLVSLVLGMTPAGLFLGMAAAGLAWSRRNRHQGNKLLSWKFWLIPAIFILIIPFFAAEPNREIFGLGFSGPRLRQGAGFLFRAYLFLLVAGCLLSDLRLESVVAAAGRFHLPQVGLRLALALGITHSVHRSVVETWQIFRSQRAGIPASAREIHVYWGALLRNAARQAEETARLLYLRNIRLDRADPAGGIAPADIALPVLSPKSRDKVETAGPAEGNSLPDGGANPSGVGNNGAADRVHSVVEKYRGQGSSRSEHQHVRPRA